MSSHSTATQAVVLDCEISELRLLLQQYAGALIDRPTETLTSLVEQHLAACKLGSASDLIATIRANPTSCESLLEALLPGDTGFFRHSGVCEAFQRQALPEIEARKHADSSRSLRIWSAGCSTGEEAYTIGMMACEGLQLRGGWNIHVVAAEIRRAALAVAERGLYPAAAVNSVPRHLISSYFSKIGEDHFLIKPRLRNLVAFTRMNLVEPAFIGKFDCIFCMDLLPHLSASHRSALVQRLHLYLEPGGYLFIGDHSKLPAAEVNFLVHSASGCTYYQRPMAAAAKTGK